jgi:hypothetical protein
MDRKVLVFFGAVIVLIASAGAFMLINKDDNDNTTDNKYDGIWLKIVAFGNSDDESILRSTDTQLIIHVGLASYTPSKIGKAPNANVEVHGCGVDYVGIANENGYLAIPVKYEGSGTLVITATYDTLSATETFKVQQ